MIINEISITARPLSSPGIWYTPAIAESSFIDNVKIRINETGPAEIKFDLSSGRSYVYSVTDDEAASLWDDLADGASPGGIFSYVRTISGRVPSDYKPEPTDVTWPIVTETAAVDVTSRTFPVTGSFTSRTFHVTGDSATVELLASYIDFLGLRLS